MDRRSFVAMLGSIPFVNKLTMEALPEKEIEKIQALDEATLLVIRKAQAITDGFLTGFKNVEFKLLPAPPFNPEDAVKLTIKSYTIENGVARISFKNVKTTNIKQHNFQPNQGVFFNTKDDRRGIEFATVIATYDNKYISSFNVHPIRIRDEDILEINVVLSIAC